MNLSQIYHRFVDIGQAADAFARQHPQHRIAFRDGGSGSLFTSARDLATGIENAIRSLSPATLDRIARS